MRFPVLRPDTPEKEEGESEIDVGKFVALFVELWYVILKESRPRAPVSRFFGTG